MPFKEKAIVRHKLRPDWGAGRVMSRSDEYLQIDFTAGGLIKLKTSIADDHLEAASDEEARALKPPKVKAKRVAAAPVEEAPKGVAGLKAAVAAKNSAPAKGVVAPAKPVAPVKPVAPAKAVAKAAPAKAAPAKAAAKPAAAKSAPAKSAKSAAKSKPAPAKAAAKAKAKKR